MSDGEIDIGEAPFDSGEFDLHTFSPGDLRDLVPDFLDGCASPGHCEVHIVHGQGTGALRSRLEALLRRHSLVECFHPGDEDSHRPLMARVRRMALDAGRTLHQRGVTVDEVLVSPYVCADETATLLLAGLGREGQVEVTVDLEPRGRPHRVDRHHVRPRALLPQRRLALARHEPSVGGLLSELVGRPGLALARGGVVELAWGDPPTIA